MKTDPLMALFDLVDEIATAEKETDPFDLDDWCPTWDIYADQLGVTIERWEVETYR